MAIHKHNIKDVDTRFVIDPVTRQIWNKTKKFVLVQFDHNSERYTFEMPRFIEGHDMSEVNRIEVHYINIEQKTKNEKRDMYLVEDLRISADDSEKVLFSWLVSANATQLIGSLHFLINFICSDGEEVGYSWQTAIYNGLKIIEGMSNTAQVMQDNSDILEAWKKEILAGVEAVKMPDKTLTVEGMAADSKAVGEALEKKLNSDKLPDAINEALSQAKASGLFNGKDGEDGEDGYTPQKNVDYFDGKDGYTPQKNVDYFDGKDGYTPQKNVDYFDGKNGFSPIVLAEEIEGGYRITLTDTDGTQSFNILHGRDAQDGDSGATFTPSVSKSGDLSWSNDKGLPNPETVNIKGDDGFPPTVSAEAIEGGYRITLTDAKKTQTVDVLHGVDGEDGNPGKDGISILSVEQTVTSEDDEGINTFVITLSNDETAEFTVRNGSKGNPGYTPQKNIDYFDGEDGVSIATIEQITESTEDNGENVFRITLSNGQSATFTVRNGSKGSKGDIPQKGVDYTDGKDGEDGIPATHSWNGTVLTISSASGSSSADLKGGKGDKGDTPQKGTDYWTDEDIQSIVTKTVNDVLANKAVLLQAAYPIGAIYLSTSATNPQTLFGFGTWERIQDRFLLAAGSAYSAGSTGGSANHTHKYKTGARVYYGMVVGADADAHMAYDYAKGAWIPAVKDEGQSSLPVKANTSAVSSTKEASPYFMASEANVSNSDNMPPYLSVYVWKRTA